MYKMEIRPSSVVALHFEVMNSNVWSKKGKIKENGSRFKQTQLTPLANLAFRQINLIDT